MSIKIVKGLEDLNMKGFTKVVGEGWQSGSGLEVWANCAYTQTGKSGEKATKLMLV